MVRLAHASDWISRDLLGVVATHGAVSQLVNRQRNVVMEDRLRSRLRESAVLAK
jgi:hypothetical protein